MSRPTGATDKAQARGTRRGGQASATPAATRSATRTAERPRTAEQPPRTAAQPTGMRAAIGRWFSAAGARPGLDYLMLRICVLTLVGIGMLMAYSASMATSVAEDGAVWQQALRQSLMVIAGLFCFWLGLRIPPRKWRSATVWLLLLAIALLLVVLTPVGTGREEVGSQSWIVVAGISIQPSEIARIAIALFGANLLADRRFGMYRPRTIWDYRKDPFVQYTAVALGMFGLIIAQGDMGMGMSFALVAIFTLFFAGMHKSMFYFILILAIVGVAVLFTGGGYRTNRFHTYFDALVGNIQDTQGTGFQTYQGFLSLADGGLTGVGLGQSRAKWFYLPEARNDFVFAIVGEEMGLWGGFLVITLFFLLGFFGFRTAMRAQNQFQGLAAGTLTAAVVSQAFFNISYVIGLLPVTGIQLPMISAGGTAAIITIGSMGLLCNIARHEPAQVSAMQNYGRPLFDRLLWIPEPEPSDAAPRTGGRRRADGSGAPRDAHPERPAAPAGAHERPTRAREREQSHRARFGAPVTSRATSRRASEQPTARGGRSTRTGGLAGRDSRRGTRRR